MPQHAPCSSRPWRRPARRSRSHPAWARKPRGIGCRTPKAAKSAGPCRSGPRRGRRRYAPLCRASGRAPGDAPVRRPRPALRAERLRRGRAEVAVPRLAGGPERRKHTTKMCAGGSLGTSRPRRRRTRRNTPPGWSGSSARIAKKPADHLAPLGTGRKRAVQRRIAREAPDHRAAGGRGENRAVALRTWALRVRPLSEPTGRPTYPQASPGDPLDGRFARSEATRADTHEWAARAGASLPQGSALLAAPFRSDGPGGIGTANRCDTGRALGRSALVHASGSGRRPAAPPGPPALAAIRERLFGDPNRRATAELRRSEAPIGRPRPAGDHARAAAPSARSTRRAAPPRNPAGRRKGARRPPSRRLPPEIRRPGGPLRAPKTSAAAAASSGTSPLSRRPPAPASPSP